MISQNNRRPLQTSENAQQNIRCSLHGRYRSTCACASKPYQKNLYGELPDQGPYLSEKGQKNGYDKTSS